MCSVDFSFPVARCVILVRASDSLNGVHNSLTNGAVGGAFFKITVDTPRIRTGTRVKVIAHSSAEAEYAACSYACREVVFVRNVLGDLGFQISGPTVVAVDNQAAIKIAEK